MRFQKTSQFIASANSGIISFAFRIPVFAVIIICSALIVLETAAAASKVPWDVSLKPGDKVCIYDIDESDPLVDGYNDSLKYWDSSSSGDRKARRVLRASVRRLLLRALEPGIVVAGVPDNSGNYWYSGAFVVVAGGYNPTTEKSYIIQRGKNTLLGQKGRSWVKNWSVIYFEKARFKKKGLMGNCMRKYNHY